MKKVLTIEVYEATGADGRNYFPNQVLLDLHADTADAARVCASMIGATNRILRQIAAQFDSPDEFTADVMSRAADYAANSTYHNTKNQVINHLLDMTKKGEST